MYVVYSRCTTKGDRQSFGSNRDSREKERERERREEREKRGERREILWCATMHTPHTFACVCSTAPWKHFELYSRALSMNRNHRPQNLKIGERERERENIAYSQTRIDFVCPRSNSTTLSSLSLCLSLPALLGYAIDSANGKSLFPIYYVRSTR